MERGSIRLAERRRLRRRLSLVVFAILIVLVIGAIIYGIRQNALRISHVEVFGADASFSTYATNAMQGSYFGIIPRDSILFFPEKRIRADILVSHNDIAAVSIFRNGFTGISIKVDYRVPIARWCGLGPTEGVEEYCYVIDANGTVFAAAAMTTRPINPFSLYAPLVGNTLEPMLATISNAGKLPEAFDFARQLATLGSPVEKVVIKDGEVNDFLASGTRVTYVLGREQDAFTALVSARDNFNLSDSSVDYIDLRFDGKVYLKKK